MKPRLILPLVALLLSGCDIPGLGPDAATVKENDGKAVGSACRHALRGIEDCFTLNPKLHKSAIFTGWKEMDAYMRENKLEGTPSVVSRAEKPAPAEDAPAAEEAEPKSKGKTASGHS